MQDIYKPEGYNLTQHENRELTESIQGLEYAYSVGSIIEGIVIKCDNERNLTVEIGNFTGIIPREEAVMPYGTEPIRDIAIITRVGKPVCVKITSLEKNALGTYNIKLSRRLAQRECYDKYISYLESGDIIDAKITHLEPFGAFCDIGCGIISLLSVDCISVSRIMHPKDRFHIGQYIRAAVKNTADELGRITLTHKELLGTWEENASRFSPGETAAGIVRSIEPYGIFVELAPNLAGLAEWREEVRAGQSAAVYIKSIIPEKMKIKLVIVDTQSSGTGTKPPEYFIEGDRIDYWKYSPDSCSKIIETIF